MSYESKKGKSYFNRALLIGVLIIVVIFVGWKIFFSGKDLGHGFYSWHGNVYLKGDSFVYGDTLLVGVDPETFTVVDNSLYVKDKKGIFAIIYGPGIRVVRIQGADISSFVGVGGSFGKDKDRVFFNDRVVESADPATFVFFHRETPRVDYAKDKLHVFFQDRIISDRPEMLRIVAPSRYGATMDFYDYVTDGQKVFSNGDEVKGANSATFEAPFFQAPEYARDARSVYFKGFKMEGVDSQSFVVLSKNYAKDRNHVYFLGPDYAENPCADKPCIVEVADPKTFSLNETGGGYDAQDASYHFLDGNVVTK